ncbi:fructose 1,6-bisphosphatase [Chlorella sorokiniana]|uniref:Fructose 1,6-bisphosphatase n=1 Tax=Chlorella sorokiniana TaxID=3076 RepID=A0A2P6TCD3_CHLSO|nr:fructose 1,6-bisphosphatase [Chlorella sorokiniana]|eukprot:PRW20289.1 fructose 1,6-bisphosphatase [Chlorella sorokiniana]
MLFAASCYPVRVPVAALPAALSQPCGARSRLSPLRHAGGLSAVPARHLLQQRPRPARRRAAAGVAAAPVQAVLGSASLLVAGAALGGILLGLLIAKAASDFFKSKEFSQSKALSENAILRAKVDELQQMVMRYEPLAYKSMRLRFTKGVNKAVILSLVDELLARKEVNIWWLPDNIERMLYFNVISLMLSVLDEIVEGMSMNFAGHNVKLSLTYLDLDSDGHPRTGDSSSSQAGGSGSPRALPAT